MNNLNLIEESITCSICNDIFARPIFLPCFNSICEKHVAEQGNVKLYKCLLCANEHQIPEYGFKPNTMALKLIHSFSLNDVKNEYEAYKNELYDLISEAEKCLPEFQTFCIEAFKDLKKKLFSTREQIISNFDKLIEALLKKYINQQKVIIRPIDELELDHGSLTELKQYLDSKFNAHNESKRSVDDFKDYKTELDSIINEISLKLNKVDDIKNEIAKTANLNIIDDVEQFVSELSRDKSSASLNSSKNSKGSSKSIDEFKDNYIISCSRYNIISVWNMYNGNCINSFDDYKNQIKSIHVLSGERLLTISNDFKLKIWDLKDGKCLQYLSEHVGPVNCVLSMPNDTILIGGKSTLEIWDFNNNTFDIVGAHKGNINTMVKFSDNYFLTGSDDGFVKIWDFNLGERIKNLRNYGQVFDIKIAKNLNIS